MQDKVLNIYLTGFMGSGKSSVGRKLSKSISWDFIDLDEFIERKENAKINEVFKFKGEKYFRDLEYNVLLDISKLKGYVVSLGGGTFCFEENILLIKESGKVIWLKCPLSEVYNRIKSHSERPLANNRQSFENLYYYRLNFYKRADFSVENFNKSIGKCTQEIIFILKLRGYI